MGLFKLIFNLTKLSSSSRWPLNTFGDPFCVSWWNVSLCCSPRQRTLIFSFSKRGKGRCIILTLSIYCVWSNHWRKYTRLISFNTKFHLMPIYWLRWMPWISLETSKIWIIYISNALFPQVTSFKAISHSRKVYLSWFQSLPLSTLHPLSTNSSVLFNLSSACNISLASCFLWFFFLPFPSSFHLSLLL